MTNASSVWDGVLAKRHGKNLKAEASETAPATESEADIRKRLAAEEAQRHADIAAACDLAGKPERAAGFIAAGKTVSQALAALSSAGQRPKS